MSVVKVGDAMNAGAAVLEVEIHYEADERHYDRVKKYVGEKKLDNYTEQCNRE